MNTVYKKLRKLDQYGLTIVNTNAYDGDAIQTASGWDIINNDDQFIGSVLDGELVELEFAGLKFRKFCTGDDQL
jgi:hypothetical protein